MRLKVTAFWLVALTALFVFLQEYSRFHFFFIEQSQLFQFTGEYISGKLSMPGGYSYAGAGITAVLLLFAGIGMRGIVRRIVPDTGLFLLYLIPVILLMFLHFDFNYLVFGTIAFNLMLLALYLCLRISDDKWRMIAEIVVTPLLYGLAGAVACKAKLRNFTGFY